LPRLLHRYLAESEAEPLARLLAQLQREERRQSRWLAAAAMLLAVIVASLWWLR
jgi:hypothetical protein